MAEFPALAIDQNRNQFAIFRFEFRIGIDIQHINIEKCHAGLAAQGFQRGEHVVTEVAVLSTEQRQQRCPPSRVPAIFQTSP